MNLTASSPSGVNENMATDICPKCKTPVDATAQSRFCLECGADLSNASGSEKEAGFWARAKAAAEARAEARAEEEARAKEEAEARAKAQAEAQAQAAAAASAKAAAEARARAEAKAEEEAKAKAWAEMKAKAEAEAKAKVEAEMQAKAAARAKAEAEARAKAEAKERAKAEAKMKAQAEARYRAEARKKERAERNAKLKASASKAPSVIATAAKRIFVALVALSFIYGVAAFGYETATGSDLHDDMPYVFAYVTGTLDSEAPYVKGPIYRISKETSYDSSGNLFFQYDYEYDEKGNSTKLTSYYPNTGLGIAEHRYTRTWGDFLPEGYPREGTDDNGASLTFKYLWGGKVSKHPTYQSAKGWDSETRTDYEYHINGKPKRIVVTKSDEITTREYDGRGYIQKITTEAKDKDPSIYPNSTETTYKWTFSKSGKRPESCIVTRIDLDDADNNLTANYQFTCDSAGNIIKARSTTESTVLGEPLESTNTINLEYVKIDNPSTAAWTEANTIDAF